MYGVETMFPVSFIFKPFCIYGAIIINADMYWLLTPPFMLISPPSKALPKILRGGYPSFSMYSMRAPKLFRASTSKAIGRFFMRSLPVMVHSPIVFERKAVRNRMEVPAAPMSKMRSLEFSTFTNTLVSSQFARF